LYDQPQVPTMIEYILSVRQTLLAQFFSTISIRLGSSRTMMKLRGRENKPLPGPIRAAGTGQSEGVTRSGFTFTSFSGPIVLFNGLILMKWLSLK
jgi:hypothetical protein